MKNWKSLVRNLAPTIAAGLGGPLAGTATKFLADKLLGNPDAKEQDIEQYLVGATPADLAKLRELDNQFAIEMAQLDVDVFALEVDDRKSAREMAKTNMVPQVILSGIFIGGYFGILYVLFSGVIDVNPDQATLISTLLGVLTAGVTSIMQFWFGSSVGSKDKTSKMIGANG